MKCLGLDKKDFIDEAPLQVVSTGVPFLMIPVSGLDILKKVQINRPLFQSLLIGSRSMRPTCSAWMGLNRMLMPMGACFLQCGRLGRPVYRVCCRVYGRLYCAPWALSRPGFYSGTGAYAWEAREQERLKSSVQRTKSNR